MDFTPEPQHSQGYRPTSYHQQDHSQHTRHYYQSPSPRTFIHSQPPSPVSTSSFEHSRFRHNSSTGQLLPEVGQTRCYWALLSSDLRFLVLDPVLAYHLHEQASDILNTSLLDFVHPDEKESAKQDLGGVLNERTLHGSVTRVRFCRLSCVRRLLGYTTSEEAPPYPPTFPADRIAIDYNYMAIDIVLNWAAEGVVLCFLHAVVDIAPREDNDESLKTGWSNWCSTYGFDEQAQSMFHCLSDCILPQMRYNEECKPDPSLRVLQILRNNMERSLVLSWPPENISIQTYNTVPDAHDLGRLAQHVEIGTLGGGTNGGDAKTSCTRRYKSYQKMPLATNDEGDVEVESIFVPHGTIIFACHKIDYIHPHQQSYNNGTLYQGNPSEEMVVDYMPPVSQRRTYSVAGSAYDLPYAEESSEHDHLSSYVEQWVEGQSQSCTPSSHDQWDRAQSHEQSPSPNPSTIGINAVAERATNSLVNMTCGTDWNPKARLRSPTRVSEKACPISSAAHNPTRPIKEKLPRHSDCAPGSDRSRNLHPNTPRESYSGSGRSSGNPPVGVSRCTSCRATHSPEWRKGPSGKKDLCNACGLRYARNRAKKEGITTRKRKDKDKGPTKHASSTSLSAASEQYPSSVPTSFVTTDNASLGESPHLTRDSPSNLSDTSGAGLSNLSVSREVGSINGSFRHYSRSESPSFADGFMVSGVRDNSGLYKVPSDSRHVPVKCSSARFVQSTNEPNQFTAGRSGSQGVSTHLTYDNVERGSYETSSSRWGGMDNDCQALVNSREGLAQNGTMPLRQSSYPPNSRLAGRSSSLRPTTDI